MQRKDRLKLYQIIRKLVRFMRDTFYCRTRRLAIAAACMIAATGILYILANIFGDSFFSVYRPFSRRISGILGNIFSFLPISVAELLLYCTVVFFAAHLIISSVHGIIKRSWRPLLSFGVSWLFAAVVICFFFQTVWGMNYIATPRLEEQLGLEVRERPEQDLIDTCRWLAEQVREDALSVPRKADGSVDGGGFDELKKGAREAMKALGGQNPVFAGIGDAAPKQILNSISFSYLGITGIYSPFTGESNVNTLAVDAMLPYTMLHEMAHRGNYASEDDANFVAYLACRASSDAVFRYSGSMSALFYCINDIEDETVRAEIYAGIPSQVWDDIRAQNVIDNRMDQGLKESVTAIASSVNDSYLMSMSQEDGVKSYGRVKDLLIAEYFSTKE